MFIKSKVYYCRMKDGWYLLVIGFVLGAIAVHLTLPQQVEIPFVSASEASSPSDRISESQLILSKENLVVNVPNLRLTGYADTNSMDPLLDIQTTGIEVTPANAEEIQVGDVIVYQSSIGLIPHRVIEKGVDDKGVFFIVKGDNNPVPDPERVYFSQVKYVLVGVLY